MKRIVAATKYAVKFVTLIQFSSDVKHAYISDVANLSDSLMSYWRCMIHWCEEILTLTLIFAIFLINFAFLQEPCSIALCFSVKFSLRSNLSRRKESNPASAAEIGLQRVTIHKSVASSRQTTNPCAFASGSTDVESLPSPWACETLHVKGASYSAWGYISDRAQMLRFASMWR